MTTGKYQIGWLRRGVSYAMLAASTALGVWTGALPLIYFNGFTAGIIVAIEAVRWSERTPRRRVDVKFIGTASEAVRTIAQAEEILRRKGRA